MSGVQRGDINKESHVAGSESQCKLGLFPEEQETQEEVFREVTARFSFSTLRGTCTTSKEHLSWLRNWARALVWKY